MPYKNGVPCICEICICGRHACPHKTKRSSSKSGIDTRTEYVDSFIPRPFCRPEPILPKSKLTRDDTPFPKSSTHKLDFVPHPIGDISRHRPTEYVRNDEPMESTTMYSKDFVPKEIDVRKPMKHVSRVVPAEFHGESTSRADYRPWDVTIPKLREPEPWKPPTEALDATPLYALNYKPHAICPTSSFKPESNINIQGQPFFGLTGYKQEFVEHPLEPQSRKKKEVWAKPKAPFDDLTTFQKEFTEKPLSKLEPFLPKQSCLGSKEPISGLTTTKNDYLPWENLFPERYSRPDYVPPEGSIEFDTMYNKDFVRHPVIEKRSAILPARREGGPVPFNGDTCYKNEFKGWKTEMPPRAKAPSTWSTPSEEMDGTTTYKTEFIPRSSKPPHPCKQEVNIPTSRDPMSGESTYKQEFVKKLIECPAALLDTPRALHTYKETDEATGHKYYEPLYVTVRDGKSKECTDIPLTKNNSGQYTFMLPGSLTQNVVVAKG